MKSEFPRLGIGKLSGLFGKTRHAYYDHKWREEDNLLKDDIILQLVQEIRTALPGIGTRKLQHILGPKLLDHNIKAGRDYLFDLLAQYKLLVRTRRRRAITTNSKHWLKKYSNLIKELEVGRPEELWVSDITYIRLVTGFGYLSLITDAYSRKIMGFNFRRDLSSEGCLIALQMALMNRSFSHLPLIHHSDRGSQYCCKDYVGILSVNSIAISMTDNGDPYENPVAERINGTIKTEFKLHTLQMSFEEADNLIKKSISAYNQLRPHASCDYLTPNEAHQKSGRLKKRWTNYYKRNTNP